MSQYALIKDNMLLNICEWDGISPFNPGDGVTLMPMSSMPSSLQVGSTRDGEGTWSPPAFEPLSTYTFLQFMALFTPTEQAAIVNSTDTQVKLFVMMATGSGGLQLSNPEVITGVNYLASVSILTAQRAIAILAGHSPA